MDRRVFMAAAAAGVLAPTVTPAKECPAAGMDWMTMSLEARNLAYFNVAHVGPDFARAKTESWAAASKGLREQRPKHLDLAYGPKERTKWDLYPASDPKAPCFVHIHGGLLAARQQGDIRVSRRGCLGKRLVGSAAGLHPCT